MSEHIHTRLDKKELRERENCSYTIFEKLLGYQDKKLLPIQRKSSMGIPWVLVPGFVEKYRERLTPRSLPISDISEVPEELRSDIATFLHRQGLEGHVNFWHI